MINNIFDFLASEKIEQQKQEQKTTTTTAIILTVVVVSMITEGISYWIYRTRKPKKIK